MEWSQVVVVLVAFVGLFMWTRTESRADQRQMDQRLEAMQRETNALIEAIRQDIKDFHGRLCTIEERNRRDK